MKTNREFAEEIVDDILIKLGEVAWVGGALEGMPNESYYDLEETLIKVTEQRIEGHYNDRT
jgi:hypothetical protein